MPIQVVLSRLEVSGLRASGAVLNRIDILGRRLIQGHCFLEAQIPTGG